MHSMQEQVQSRDSYSISLTTKCLLGFCYILQGNCLSTLPNIHSQSSALQISKKFENEQEAGLLYSKLKVIIIN